jgi:repressor LexA
VGAGGVSSVPLLGTVAAGLPILALQHIQEYIPFKDTGRRDLFALQVKGESMIEDAILDGDIVIVESSPVVRNGEIAVVLVEEEATVKRFYKEKGHFRLQPANSSMEPIICNEAVVLGRVIAVIRHY